MKNKITKQEAWDLIKDGTLSSLVKEESRGKSLASSKEVADVFLAMSLAQDDVEQMFCMFLDAQNRIISIDKLSQGTICASAIYTRELVKAAIKHKAAAVIISHNHPSGEVHPSNEDKLITRKIGLAFAVIDVTLHDHIIVGNSGMHFSFADGGLISNYMSEINMFMKNK